MAGEWQCSFCQLYVPFSCLNRFYCIYDLNESQIGQVLINAVGDLFRNSTNIRNEPVIISHAITQK